MDRLTGKLLIAGPALWDPNFRRTVLLIAQHDADGAVGVVLNRPSDVAVRDAVPALAEFVGGEQHVFVGGPVQPQAAVVIAEFERPDAAGLLAFDSVGFVIGDVEPEQLRQVRRARVFAGYAGWGAGQLEREMEEEGSWIIEDARVADVFSDEPERLWTNVVRRKGPEFAMLALMPLDPSLN